jgi:eukaryotic-like serine/threonine-protein kinase
MNTEAAQQRWKKVKELFHEALRLEPHERDVFLDRSCDGDAELRVEVESLLLSLNEAETFLEEPVLLAPPEKEVAWQFSKGQVISHYRILEPIGAGGMAEVYLAEDTKLHRQVALKVLPSEVLQDIDRLRRFKREALAVSALNHPNILTIFEFDSVNGINLLASEFVKGKTLRQAMRDGPLKLSDAVEIAIQVASALGTAHDAGVVHRDIKPENIMIRNDGYVKVLDFGLAKLNGDMRSLEGAHTHTQSFSLPGLIMGTVTYMSPEQARSKSIDSRTDIFSFGIVLYEMLTGRPPFKGESMTDVIAEIIQKEPSSASALNPAVPEQVDRIVAKCLEKDRNDRYQTAAELLTDLRATPKTIEVEAPVTEKTIQTQPTEVLQPDTRRETNEISIPDPSKNRYWLSASITGAVIVLAVIGSFYWYTSTDNQIASIAVIPFRNDSGNADIEYLSDGMTESLISALSTLPNLSVKAWNSVFRYKGAAIDEKTVGQDLSVQALLLGRITQRDDDVALKLELVDATTGTVIWSEQYDRKMQDLAVLQKEITRDVSQKVRVRLSNAAAGELTKSYTSNSEAYQDYLRGRYFWNKRSPSTIEKAKEYFEKAIEKDPGFALAYAGLADFYVVPVIQIPPREAMPKAKAAAMRALQIDDTLAEAHASLARVLQLYEWNWKESEKEYTRAIQLNPRYAVAHQWRKGYFESRMEEAIAQRRIAVELDPLSPIANFELGRAFYLNNEYDKSLEQFNKALELEPTFAAALQYLPLVYIHKGMPNEAVAAIRKNPESFAMIRHGTSGYVLAAAGHQAEARQVLADLKRLRNETYVSAVAIALIYAGLGENEEALNWLNIGYQERSFQMQFVKVEPSLATLRNEPRFAELLRRMNAPE